MSVHQPKPPRLSLGASSTWPRRSASSRNSGHASTQKACPGTWRPSSPLVPRMPPRSAETESRDALRDCFDNRRSDPEHTHLLRDSSVRYRRVPWGEGESSRAESSAAKAMRVASWPLVGADSGRGSVTCGYASVSDQPSMRTAAYTTMGVRSIPAWRCTSTSRPCLHRAQGGWPGGEKPPIFIERPAMTRAASEYPHTMAECSRHSSQGMQPSAFGIHSGRVEGVGAGELLRGAGTIVRSRARLTDEDAATPQLASWAPRERILGSAPASRPVQRNSLK